MSAEEKKSEEVPEKIKVMMVVTSNTKLGDTGKQTGWYIPEAAHPYYVFKRQDYEVTWVSPRGGLSEPDEGSLTSYKDDPECQAMMRDVLDDNNKLETVSITSVNARLFHVIFFVGGLGTMWDFPKDTFIQDATQKIYNEHNGIVGAVCHGPCALVGAMCKDGKTPIVKGKKVTGFSDAEEVAMKLDKVVPFLLETKLKAIGADYSCAALWQSHAVRDGRIVTGQNPASAHATAQLIVEAVNENFYGIKKKTAVNCLFVVTSHNKLGDTGKQTGWYWPEVAHPYYVFKESGFDKITFASPRGGLTDCDDGSLDAFKNDPACLRFQKEHMALKTPSEEHKTQLETIALSAVNANDYNVVFFAGGHGTCWDFKDDTTVIRAGETVYQNGGIVSAVCHGPCALINLKADKDGKKYIVDGKKLTHFSDEEEDKVGLTKVVPFLGETELVKRGAIYSKADKPFGCHAVADDRVITGQNPASAFLVARLIVKRTQSF